MFALRKTYRSSGGRWRASRVTRGEDLAVRVALVVDALGPLDTHICNNTETTRVE